MCDIGPGTLVSRVEDEADQGQDQLDFRPFQESLFLNGNRNPHRPKHLGDLSDTRTVPQQDGDIPKADGLQDLLLLFRIQFILHLMHHLTGLGLHKFQDFLSEGPVVEFRTRRMRILQWNGPMLQGGAHPFQLGPVGFQAHLLDREAERFAEDFVGGIHQFRTGAVGNPELHPVAFGETADEILHQRTLRAPETIDGLLFVAYKHAILHQTLHLPENIDLHRVGILELIHHHLLVGGADILSDVNELVIREDEDELLLQVIEVQQAILRLEAAVLLLPCFRQVEQFLGTGCQSVAHLLGE